MISRPYLKKNESIKAYSFSILFQWIQKYEPQTYSSTPALSLDLLSEDTNVGKMIEWIMRNGFITEKWWVSEVSILSFSWYLVFDHLNVLMGLIHKSFNNRTFLCFIFVNTITPEKWLNCVFLTEQMFFSAQYLNFSSRPQSFHSELKAKNQRLILPSWQTNYWKQ